MKRSEFFKEIAKRTGIHEKKVKEIIEESESLILEIFATNDYLYTAYGKLEGVVVPPQKVQGFYAVLDRVVSRNGWSCAKSGKPKITFNKKATLTYRIAPDIFFNSPEERLTTLARIYRQDVGLPEIPEYEGLPEDKIQELCKRIDKEKGRALTKSQLKRKEANRLHREKYKLTREALMVEMDLQRQRDLGIEEDQLIRRTPEDIKREVMLQWAERSRVKQIIYKKYRDKIEREKLEEKIKKELEKEDEQYFFSI